VIGVVAYKPCTLAQSSRLWIANEQLYNGKLGTYHVVEVLAEPFAGASIVKRVKG
jgi:hypothetical protein